MHANTVHEATTKPRRISQTVTQSLNHDLGMDFGFFSLFSTAGEAYTNAFCHLVHLARSLWSLFTGTRFSGTMEV